MKMLMAVIKPFKLNDVRQALGNIGIEGMTVTEVTGYGRQKGHAETSRGEEVEVHFLPKAKIEVAIPDHLEAEAVKIITEAANTGRIGDGKIFVYDLTSVLRIRTGETDRDAL
jgi:nitrogen regulatory protein PII